MGSKPMKPWQYWIAFSVCLAVLFVPMGWVSMTALRLDRAQAEARQQAAFEGNVRLALWRMETALTPLLARESSRPYFVYSTFYPAERAYTKMFEEIGGWEVMMPSPLLTEVTPYMLLHFQMDPAGNVTSPQVPSGKMRALSISAYANDDVITVCAVRLAKLKEQMDRNKLLAALPENQRDRASSRVVSLAQAQVPAQGVQKRQQVWNQPQQVVEQQAAMNITEWNVRKQQQEDSVALNVPPSQKKRKDGAAVSSDVSEGIMKPLWLGDILLLARQVTVNGGDYIQGCWLDWPEIKRELLGKIGDLLTGADLEPVLTQPEGGSGGRMLAGLPVRLVLGKMPEMPSSGMTPVKVSLLIAWSCVLLAAGAVGVLLVGAVSLSERRGAFVSAVTHELRTPLTTFRMYSEMLAEGMVTDQRKQGEYLETLCAEGNRLSHLVENVLSYARLERGRVTGQVETLAIKDIVERIKERLTQRAEQAGMTLAIEKSAEMLSLKVRMDMSALEQILFNLVDNACKYAVSAKDKRIHLEADRGKGTALIRVWDHGPGIPEEEVRRLFRPFCKSAKHAAESAPGVGLGLALSRRLARQMGGDLRIRMDVTDGACFELIMPAVSS